MDCQSIMHVPPTRMHANDTLKEAIDLMVARHMKHLPVVDDDEVFLGEISTVQLVQLLMPKFISVMRGLRSPSYLRESLEDLRQRLERGIDRPVSDFIDRRVPVVRPDSPLIDALVLLQKRHITVPVVEEESGRLVGAISLFTVLGALGEKD